MLGARKRKRAKLQSEGEGSSTDEEPSAKRSRSPGWFGRTFSSFTTKVKGTFRAMKGWFKGREEEVEREGASQRSNSHTGDFRQSVLGSDCSTSFDGDSVLLCSDSDAPSPPLMSVRTGHHTSHKDIQNSDTVNPSRTGQTPLFNQMERKRDRSQYFCLLQTWAATHQPSVQENTTPQRGSRLAHHELTPPTPSTRPQASAVSPPAPSPPIQLWSRGTAQLSHRSPRLPPPPATAVEQTEVEEDSVFKRPVRSKAAAPPYIASYSPPRAEFERLQAHLKDLKSEVLEHRTDFAAQSQAFEKYAALARKEREELLDTLASRLYRVGLGEEVEEEEEDEQEKKGELGVSLTQKQLQKVEEVWSGFGSNDQVMSSLPRLSIRRCDLLTLRGLEWLNDEVINFYMALISDRSQQKGAPLRAHGMTTFFYPKLLTSGYNGVRRWTKKVDVFSYDVVIVPVHLGVHWALAIIDLREKLIIYFDSMRGDNHACHHSLKDWLVAEAKDKKGTVLSLAGWKTATPKDIPRQQNSSDCGVFACMFARFYANGKPFTFKQADMQDIRSRMVCEIVERRLF